MKELRNKILRTLGFAIRVFIGNYGLPVFFVAMATVWADWRIVEQWFALKPWLQIFNAGLLAFAQLAVLSEIVFLFKTLGLPGHNTQYSLAFFGKELAVAEGPEQLVVYLTAGSTLEWCALVGLMLFAMAGVAAHSSLFATVLAFCIYVLISCLSNLLIALFLVRSRHGTQRNQE
jgi:hypothetical protein